MADLDGERASRTLAAPLFSGGVVTGLGARLREAAPNKRSGEHRAAGARNEWQR